MQFSSLEHLQKVYVILKLTGITGWKGRLLTSEVFQKANLPYEKGSLRGEESSVIIFLLSTSRI